MSPDPLILLFETLILILSDTEKACNQPPPPLNNNPALPGTLMEGGRVIPHHRHFGWKKEFHLPSAFVRIPYAFMQGPEQGEAWELWSAL